MSSSFAFDNASNHCCFAEDALIASNVSPNPGVKQLCMREGFDYASIPHPRVSPDNHPNFSLRGKAKGAEAILSERNLRLKNGWRSDGFKFKLECPKKQRKAGLLELMPVAAIPRWTVPLAAALAEYSPSNKTSRNKMVNYKRR